VIFGTTANTYIVFKQHTKCYSQKSLWPKQMCNIHQSQQLG